MTNSCHVSDIVFYATPLLVAMPSGSGEPKVAEDENFPTLEEIISRNSSVINDYQKEPTPAPEQVLSVMGSKQISDMRSKFHIPDYVDIVSVGNDSIQIHQPVYYAFYQYPFLVVYSLPLLSLAEEFFRFYSVCPA